MNGTVSPRDVPNAGRAGLAGRQPDGPLLLDKEPQALDLGGAESPRLPQHRGAGASLTDLQAEGQVAGQQTKAHRDAVGMQAGTDQVIEIMPIKQLVNHLLYAPALTIEGGQTSGAQP